MAVVAALWSAGVHVRADVAANFSAILSRDLKFSPAELTDLDRGRIVRHTLGPNPTGEVAAVGAVRVNAPKQRLVDRYRDIAQFKRGPDVLQIGRFSSPPVPEDLAALTLTHEDLDLRGCRLRDCDVRLPADTIRRVQQEIDWSRSDADARAASLFKRVLFDHVHAFVSGGPGLISEYDDDKRPIRPGDDFTGLLNNSRYVDVLLPGLGAHLQAFSTTPMSDAEDFLYWSKEKFGLTPFVTVTQVTIARASPDRYVIASRDVYSSRYFDASLALTIANDAGPDAFYLVYVNRSRANGLRGPLASLRRAIVERRAKAALEDDLREVKQRLER